MAVVSRKLGTILRDNVSLCYMLTTMFLSLLLMVGGLGGAAASDPQVYGKSIYSDKTLLSSNDGRYIVRRQPHQHTKSETHRSLDLDRLNMQVTPGTRKSSLPIIIKLFQPTIGPHMHANMPMRFGRELDPDDDKSPNSPNMPQRFGRAWKVNRMCAECNEEPNPALKEMPQRFGIKSLYWRFLNPLASEEIINTGLHWAADYDFTTKKWKWMKHPIGNEDISPLY